jgi:small subunit ribosomal protein S17
MQVSGKMAEHEETVRKPVEKDAKPHKPAHDKEAPKEHRPAEAAPAKEHKPAEGAPVKEHKPAKAPAAGAAPKKKAPAAKPARPKTVGKTDIGIDVKPPAKVCTDQNCPFHGRLPVRGQIFEGVVVSDGMDKSAVVRRERLVYVPKYERYLKRTSRMSVHSPPCIEAKAGDEVTVMECRPLSKTIAFTIVSKRADQKARTD